MLEGLIVLVICLAVLVVIIQLVMPRFGITEERARAGGCACSGCGSSGCTSSAGSAKCADPSSCPTPANKTED